MPRKISFQRVKIPSGAVRVLGIRSYVQDSQLLHQSVGVFRLDTRLASRSKKLLESLVLEALDHPSHCIVYRYALQSSKREICACRHITAADPNKC